MFFVLRIYKFNNYFSVPPIFFIGNNDPKSCRTFSRTPTFAVRINGHPKYSNAFDLADKLQEGKFFAIEPISSRLKENYLSTLIGRVSS